MRVSACGIVANSIEEVKHFSKLITEVSHNHPEGLKGAEATALAVYLARSGKTKQEIYNAIKDYYDLGFSIDEIRPSYHFTEKNHETVPQALVCFFESTDFEDAIRLAVSLGGDADTLAAITGSIAAEYYGVPKWMHYKAKTYLTQELKTYLADFEKIYPPKFNDKIVKEHPFFTNLRP
jgi:type I restriction enzyme M protein